MATPSESPFKKYCMKKENPTRVEFDITKLQKVFDINKHLI